MDTVIHLAGEPIFGGLLTQARMDRIRASRVDSTRRIVDRILERASDDRPGTLICASAVGFYGDAGEDELPETAPSGEGFLAEVCRAWEKEAVRAEEGGLRVVRVRIGVVLSRESGALALMRLPFSLGVGGRLGSGRQFFPWIHVSDLAEAILFCVDSELSGAINAVAPELVRNADLTRALAAVLKRPALLPVPAWALRAALGPISGELLGSRRVIPSALIEAGFQFGQPDLRGALAAELA
jgi:hypothetical protein